MRLDKENTRGSGANTMSYVQTKFAIKVRGRQARKFTREKKRVATNATVRPLSVSRSLLTAGC